MGTAEIAELKSNCPKWKLLSATAIKLIAVVFMFMDHIHQMFVTIGAPIWLTMVGRLVFPMFLFTAAESFYYTHNKRKYLQRLLFASWGMTAFTFSLGQIIPNENVVLMNNAFSTFFRSRFIHAVLGLAFRGNKDEKSNTNNEVHFMLFYSNSMCVSFVIGRNALG